MQPSFVGPYAIVRKLGEGGMGVVYEVQDPGAPRTLALKLLREEVASATSLARFEREIDALERVRHRSVVRVLARGHAPEGPYLVQELVEGRDLDRVAQQGVEPREAARIVREVADAVAAAHGAGVLHRDLKPANVILRPDGIPVLLDFGLARADTAEALTRTGSMLGTPSFMAPEQADGGKELTPATDVYGLGAILYGVLTDEKPFDGAPMEVLMRVLTEDPTWPRALRPEVPAELDAIVRHAMAKDPAQRYPSAVDLREDLDTFLAGRRPLAADRVGLAAPRALAPLAAGAVALVLLGLGAGAWAITRPPAPEPEPSPTPSTPVEDDRPRRPSRPRDEVLWSLSEGAPYACEVRLHWQRGPRSLTMDAGLRGRATAGPTPDLLTLDMAVAHVELGVNDPSNPALDAEKAHYDTRRPKKSPLAPMQQVVGVPVRLTVSRRDGAIASVVGLNASVRAHLEREIPDPLPELDRLTDVAELPNVQPLVLKVLDDRFLSESLAALSGVRGPAATGWSRKGEGSFVLASSGGSPTLPALQRDKVWRAELRQPTPRFRCEGKARFEEGALREARVEQTRSAQGREDVTATWTWKALP